MKIYSHIYINFHYYHWVFFFYFCENVGLTFQIQFRFIPMKYPFSVGFRGIRRSDQISDQFMAMIRDKTNYFRFPKFL